MNVKFMAVIALVMVGSAASSTAKASDTDWKLYGVSTIDGNTDLCFFDIKGAIKGTDKHIKVWTKCLHKKDMDGIDLEKEFGGKILKNAADKMLNRYVPPIALVMEGVDFDKATEFAVFEEIADAGGIQPSIRVFYELDCSNEMLRELSIEVEVHGRSGSKHSASEWHYVPPETNGARLQKILCEKSLIQ
jgi:hypothetical protein